MEPLNETTLRAWLEIDNTALWKNVLALQKRLPPNGRIMAVLKANAYGHGLLPVARYLNRIGIDSFAVATLEEGIALRETGIQGEILILGWTHELAAPQLSRYRLTQTLTDLEYAVRLNRLQIPLTAHVKVDTGMHRFGEDACDTARIEGMYRLANLTIQGIYSHLYAANRTDPAGQEETARQFERFDHLIEQLKARGISPGKRHMQGSYGFLNYPGHCYELVRIGDALFGTICPGRLFTAYDQHPVLSYRARIAHIRTLPAGEGVGYNHTFTAGQESRIATISTGYADGIPRILAARGGQCLIHGKRAPLVGTICMDSLTVDVTGIPEAQTGDPVTLIGREGEEEISAMDIAQACGTIPPEIVGNLTSRPKRVYL